MASVFVRHRVADYETWKPIFDDHEGERRDAGVIGHSLHRDAADPNVLVIALRVNDIARAREFALSADLRETMMRAGVQDAPEFWFTEDIEEQKY